MESLGNFPDPFMAEIAGQPGPIRRAAAGLDRHWGELERIKPGGTGPIVFTSMGSSYDACYPAITRLAEAGIAAVHGR